MGLGVVTRSLEAQLFRSQRILKPSTLPQKHSLKYLHIKVTKLRSDHSVSRRPAPADCRKIISTCTWSQKSLSRAPHPMLGEKPLTTGKPRSQKLQPQGEKIRLSNSRPKEKKNQTVQAIDSTESLPNRPVLSKLVKPQLTTPKLELLRAGLPEVMLDKSSSILMPAIHFLKTPHLPEMPDSIQDQLKKVNRKPLGRHRKALFKIKSK